MTKLAVSPHIHSGKSTTGVMLDVVIALLPAAVAGVIIFGLRALAVIALCVAACIGFEALFCLVTKKRQTIGDLSAAVTGLLLALNLPANIPLWQCVVGSLFAIVVVKCLFGGLGKNLVNPAITARVFMLVAFASMTKAGQPTAPLSFLAPLVNSLPESVQSALSFLDPWMITPDAVAGATPLAGSEAMPGLLTLLTGYHGGAIGETCAVALLLGGIYLLVRRVISWHTPVIFIATVFVFSLFMEGYDPVRALSMVLCGGVMIGAFFMATDYVTSPPTAWGKVLFGLGCGLLTCLIRYFGSYPEGVSFAILFMNILTPYISKWTRHKVFGKGGAK